MADITAKDVITVCISIASLCLSGFAIWLVQFNRGQLKMTQPTLICLVRELPRGASKIFLRTLLFSTGPKGLVIENMFLKVRQPKKYYIFDFWGHTDGGKLTLGSGLFVGASGVTCDHHFNPRLGTDDFQFTGGVYNLEVVATVVGRKLPVKLATLIFRVEDAQAIELLKDPQKELHLYWNADTHSYTGQVEARKDLPLHDKRGRS